jgi:hypothetical protein
LSWRKPTTFGLTLITITWVSSYLRVGSRARAVLLGVFAADCVAEVGGITPQAWRHVPSHFNMQTAINTSVSMMLAVGGGILSAVLVTLAGYAFRATRTYRPACSWPYTPASSPCSSDSPRVLR